MATTVKMDAHERAAIAKRLAVVSEQIEALPKGLPEPSVIARWRSLLEEKELLEQHFSDAIKE